MVSHSYLILASNIKEIQQFLTQAVQINCSHQMGLNIKKKKKIKMQIFHV